MTLHEMFIQYLAGTHPFNTSNPPEEAAAPRPKNQRKPTRRGHRRLLTNQVLRRTRRYENNPTHSPLDKGASDSPTPVDKGASDRPDRPGYGGQ